MLVRLRPPGWYLQNQPCRILHRPFSFTRLHRSSPISAVHNTQPPPWYASMPSFRQQVAKGNQIPSFMDRVKAPPVRKQVLFFAFGSVFVFALAARFTNEDTYDWSNRLCSSGPAWKDRPPTNDEMRRARYYSFGIVLQQRLAWVKDAIDEWPVSIKGVVIWMYIQVGQPILDTTEARRLCWAIGLLNGLTYLAWQFPRGRLLMRSRFAHSPLSGLSYTMLTSLFSYRYLTHLWLTSAAMAAFGSAAAQHFFEEHSRHPENVREATPKWHFLAFIVSAGLFSNLISHVAVARFTFPRLVSRLRAAETVPLPSSPITIKPSLFARLRQKVTSPPVHETSDGASIPIRLGASGAVYSALTVVALCYPDTDLALKIPPTYPMPIQWGLGALLAVDILGILRGWRLFNHWAHVGGAVFGAFYWEYGPVIWELFRELTLGGLPPSLCALPTEQEDYHES